MYNYINYDFIIYTLKLIIICFGSLYSFIKIINKKITEYNTIFILIYIVFSIIICFLSASLKISNYTFSSFLIYIFCICLLNSMLTKLNFANSLLFSMVSICINYIILFMSICISFIFYKTFNVSNLFFDLSIIILFYFSILYYLYKLKKLKYGFSFLLAKGHNEYFEIIILTYSIAIIFIIVFYKNCSDTLNTDLFISLIVFSISTIVTIYKLFKMYYKHTLLVKDLNESKAELERKKNEIIKLEKENLELNKINHSIAHKQKSLEYKINEMIGNTSFSPELSIFKTSKEISCKLSSPSFETVLPKTEIEQLDDMLKYMQSECLKNNITFELKLSGNVHHIINKYISVDEFEILLADHIKNAIIAINSSNNNNRSILVKIGMFSGIYSIYFYDSGAEFNKEILSHLGKIPITTHKDTGGTGFGFMNTFETLNKYNASIEIKQIGPPSINNYTKYIVIKFDGKHDFKII